MGSLPWIILEDFGFLVSYYKKFLFFVAYTISKEGLV